MASQETSTTSLITGTCLSNCSNIIMELQALTSRIAKLEESIAGNSQSTVSFEIPSFLEILWAFVFVVKMLVVVGVGMAVVVAIAYIVEWGQKKIRERKNQKPISRFESEEV